jgi:hypothetical protein
VIAGLAESKVPRQTSNPGNLRDQGPYCSDTKFALTVGHPRTAVRAALLGDRVWSEVRGEQFWDRPAANKAILCSQEGLDSGGKGSIGVPRAAFRRPHKEDTMPKLTDTQLVILAGAAKRENGSILPLPRKVKLEAEAAAAVFKTLIKRKLVAPRPARGSEAGWRDSSGGDRIALVITETGLQAIGAAPQDPLTGRLHPNRRVVRYERRLLRLGHPAVQYHHLHGPVDAERAPLLRSVRARGHR